MIMKYQTLSELKISEPELAAYYTEIFNQALAGKISLDEIASVCSYSLDEAKENLELQNRRKKRGQ